MKGLAQDSLLEFLAAVQSSHVADGNGTSEPVPRPARPRALNLQLIWERRGLLKRVAVATFAISVIVALLLPHEYESSVSIMPPDSSSGLLSMLAAVTGKGTPDLGAFDSLLSLKSTGSLYISLLASRTVQDRIIDKLQLQRVYRARYMETARKTLARRTEVKEDRKSGVISVIVTDRSPRRARDIAQTYIDELNHLQAEVSTSSARRERIFIEQRLVSVKADLEDAETQFSAFASKNSTLDIKDQAKAMVESEAVLQAELIAAQSELQSLKQIYTADNVRVRTVQAKVDELRQQMQKLNGTDTALASGGDASGDLYPPIRKLPLLGVEWADLYRRVKIQETVFDLLTQRYEIARLQEAKEIATVNVIDSPNIPERKSGPHRVLIVLGCTLFSIVGALMFIAGSARLNELEADDPRKLIVLSAVTRATRARDLYRRYVGSNGAKAPSADAADGVKRQTSDSAAHDGSR